MNPASPPQGNRGRHRRTTRRAWLRAALAGWLDAWRASNGLPDMPPLPPPEPPVLRAHESKSMSQTALLEGLARVHAEEWLP